MDEVSLKISYEIIEHFSRNLYSSPNKALEELVTNGFDAAATQVHIFLPGQFVQDNVLVWDNGISMDVQGIKELWKLSDSPKKRMAERSITTSEGRSRSIIGKFGIGKLASYIVGDAIEHLCKIDDKFHLVKVDYSDVTDDLKRDAADGVEEAYSSPIYRLSETQAREYLIDLFEEVPTKFEEIFNEQNWTVAVVSQLKRKDLFPGRLSWVLSHSMPLRPDFKVFVNGDEVVSKLQKDGVLQEWSLSAPEVVTAIKAYWDRYQDELGSTSEIIQTGTERGLDASSPDTDVGFVVLPHLGKIWGVCRFYRDSLERSRKKTEGEPRSHGYFIMVRDRLVNSDDEKLLMGDPTFGIFYRSQFIIHIDGLDENLLADRERFLRDEEKSLELKGLQAAVYSVVRDEKNRRDQLKLEEQMLGFRLPLFSRQHFIEPIDALWQQKPDVAPDAELDYKNISVELKPLPDDRRMAELSSDGKHMVVNTNHPYYESVSNVVGTGRKAAAYLKEVEFLAISEYLFEGFLIEAGIDKMIVDSILEWRSSMYKILSGEARLPNDILAKNLFAASSDGGKVFESALVKVLTRIGFVAERHGASGDGDVLAKASTGDNSYLLLFEAKGKKYKGIEQDSGIPNDAAEVAGANSHGKKMGADHVVIVTRKFKGIEQKGEAAAIMEECIHLQSNFVSIMEIDVLVALMDVMSEYAYPLDLIKPVFTTIETPEEKQARVVQLAEPFAVFSFAELLDQIWKVQNEVYNGQPISYRDLYFREYKDAGIKIEEFELKIAALATLSGPRIAYDAEAKTVALKQSPDVLLERLEKHFSGAKPVL